MKNEKSHFERWSGVISKMKIREEKPAEPPLFEEWLEREIEATDHRRTMGDFPIGQASYWRGYYEALLRVRQELENGV